MTDPVKPQPAKPEPKRQLVRVITLSLFENFPIPEIQVTGEGSVKEIMNDLLHACLGIWSGVQTVPVNPPQKGVESEQAKQT